MNFANLTKCFPWQSRDKNNKIFDEAVEQALRSDIGKIPPVVEKNPLLVSNRIDSLIKEKLHLHARQPQTGFDGIMRASLSSSNDAEDAFLLRLEKRRTLFSRIFRKDTDSKRWVFRSEKETTLHILLQSQLRSKKPRSPDRGDSLHVDEIVQPSVIPSRKAADGAAVNQKIKTATTRDRDPVRDRPAVSINEVRRSPTPSRTSSHEDLSSPLLFKRFHQSGNNRTWISSLLSQIDKKRKKYGKTPAFFANCFVCPTNNKKQFSFHDAAETNGLFSNFWQDKEIEIDNEKWKSVEHYFQAQKFRELPHDSLGVIWEKESVRGSIQEANTPHEAKYLKERAIKYGRFSIDWEASWKTQKIEFMYKAVFEKFSQDEQLKAALLATGNGVMVETMPSDRNDAFWGAVSNTDNDQATGANMLGQILQQVRHDLKKGEVDIDRNVKFNSSASQIW